jgi:hypothetical protein
MAIMASRPPMLASVPPDSEKCRMIDRAGCGAWVEPEDPAPLAEGIKALRADKGRLESMGAQGRANGEVHFGRARVVGEDHRRLKEVAAEHRFGQGTEANRR